LNIGHGAIVGNVVTNLSVKLRMPIANVYANKNKNNVRSAWRPVSHKQTLLKTMPPSLYVW